MTTVTQEIPAWFGPVMVIEGYLDMRERHRSDGVLTPDEDRIEGEHVRIVVLGECTDVAESFDIAQTIQRVGIESNHAQRKIRARARRRADWLPQLAAWGARLRALGFGQELLP